MKAKNYKRTILLPLLVAGVTVCAQVRFVNNARAVFSEKPESSTGLNQIYVLYSLDGTQMCYDAANSTAQVNWYSYGNQGGAYMQEISRVTRDGKTTTLSDIIPNSGYIIEEGTTRTYVWVVDYSTYYLHLNGIAPASGQDCGSTLLDVSGSGDDILYYTINGIPKKLSREMTLRYNSLQWDADKSQWSQYEEVTASEGLKSTISVTAPLCNTTFTLEGDRFLNFWNEGRSVSSDEYATNAVDVHVTAVQAGRENSNEQKEETGDAMGGSAPVTIAFTAYCTDAVTQKEWQIGSDADFNVVTTSISQDEMEQTFTEAGTCYVRFIGRNAAGTCEVTSDTYTVSVGESVLLCPNAFSPNASEGVNDEWKVSYKSIVSFKCWIFNRWGNQICELNDPSQGWDGKYKGKYVGSGVYFYVIDALGADGKKYKLKGDINIIKSKKTSTSSSTTTDKEAE